MLTEQLTKHAVSRSSLLGSLRFVMFFETLLINLAAAAKTNLGDFFHIVKGVSDIVNVT